MNTKWVRRLLRLKEKTLSKILTTGGFNVTEELCLFISPLGLQADCNLDSMPGEERSGDGQLPGQAGLGVGWWEEWTQCHRLLKEQKSGIIVKPWGQLCWDWWPYRSERRELAFWLLGSCLQSCFDKSPLQACWIHHSSPSQLFPRGPLGLPAGIIYKFNIIFGGNYEKRVNVRYLTWIMLPHPPKRR